MSTSELEQRLSELPKTFYLPWTEGENNLDEGIAFGTGLARATGLPLEVGMQLLNQIPEELGKLPHFTERSRSSMRGPRVVLLLHPTFKLLGHAVSREGRYVVVVEYPTNELSGWAALAGAFNLKTKETMSVDLGTEALVLYKRIEWNGNNGWSDDHGKRTALSDLNKLKASGELNVDLLRGYFLPKKSDTAVERLIKLAESVLKDTA